MKTITVTAFGGPETLVLSDAPAPVAESGEVLIRVEAAGVGLVDVFQRTGRYPGFTEPGFVPGIEVAGTIEAVGGGVDAKWVGRRVFSQVPRGGYAEKVIARAVQLAPLPDALSYSDAVALGINAMVAEIAFDQAGMTAGDAVLVRGAGGGIGVLGVQVAAQRGANVVAVTSSSERGERLKALGAGSIVNRTEDAILSEAAYDVILDPVSGPDMVSFISQLKPGGRHVIVGFAGGWPGPNLSMGMVMNFQKSISVSTLSLNTVDPARLAEMLGMLFERVAAGKLKPIVDAEIPLAQAADAHRKIEGGAFGKIVLINR